MLTRTSPFPSLVPSAAIPKKAEKETRRHKIRTSCFLFPPSSLKQKIPKKIMQHLKTPQLKFQTKKPTQ